MIHEFMIGDWRAVVLSDSASEGDAERLATNWSPEHLERELTAIGDTYPKIAVGVNCLAVQTPDGWVLTDGGQGTLVGRQGQLLAALAEAGIAPDDIWRVFLTHCHADHYGGLYDPASEQFVFPNAGYVIGAVEWSHWTSPDNLLELQSSSPPRYQAVIEHLLPLHPRISLCAPGDTIAPGMTTVQSYGHTPGHLSLLIRHGGDALLYIGDLAIHPLHLKHTGAVFGNDMVASLQPAARSEALRLSRETGATILACHFAFPGLFVAPSDWPAAQ
jgi:glyoxylase-like metal-dependent hydrolase (beta-lactamase superfamily II)